MKEFLEILAHKTLFFWPLTYLFGQHSLRSFLHVQNRCKVDTLADPYQKHSADIPFQGQSAGEVPQREFIFHPHQSTSQTFQPISQAEYAFATPENLQRGFPSQFPLQATEFSQQIDPVFSQSQYLQHESFSPVEPSGYAVAPSGAQHLLPRGTKRSRPAVDEPVADRRTRPLLPHTPSIMSPMNLEEPSDSTFQNWPYRTQFFSQQMPQPQYQSREYQSQYQPLAVHQHHHHRLPTQTRHESLPPLLHSSQTGILSGATSVLGHEGMPEPSSRPRGPKLKFTAQEDQMLVELKENKNLTWKQIADFFPGRTSGTLQVRYCTKLKAKTVIWTEDTVSCASHTGSADSAPPWLTVICRNKSYVRRWRNTKMTNGD